MSRRPRAGFTLVEILIAITILVVGVVGIISLFPATIETASHVVEDTYSSSVAQSVVDALAAAQRSGQIYAANTQGLRYMIFDHDGCLDTHVVVPAPSPSASPPGPATYKTNWANDHVILLPRLSSTGVSATSEPILLYPCVDSGHCPAGTAVDRSPTGTGIAAGTTPTDVTNTSGTASTNLKAAYDGSYVIWTRRVFPLGRYDADAARPTGFAVGDIRSEFLPNDATGAAIAGSLPIDPYPQYSFALAIRRAPLDTSQNQSIDSGDSYNDDLYEIRIMVYRNWNGDTALHTAILGGTAVPKSNVPIREYVTLMEIGPGLGLETSASARTLLVNGNVPNTK